LLSLSIGAEDRIKPAFTEGDTISCTFSLPGFGQVTTGADIVRMLEKTVKKDFNRYGVKFIELSDEAASAIEAFLKKGSPHP